MLDDASNEVKDAVKNDGRGSIVSLPGSGSQARLVAAQHNLHLYNLGKAASLLCH